MRESLHLFHGKSGFMGAAGGSPRNILPDNRKDLPQGKTLEGQNDLYTGLLAHPLDRFKIPAQQALFNYITGIGYLGKIDGHRNVEI